MNSERHTMGVERGKGKAFAFIAKPPIHRLFFKLWIFSEAKKSWTRCWRGCLSISDFSRIFKCYNFINGPRLYANIRPPQASKYMLNPNGWRAIYFVYKYEQRRAQTRPMLTPVRRGKTAGNLCHSEIEISNLLQGGMAVEVPACVGGVKCVA